MRGVCTVPIPSPKYRNNAVLCHNSPNISEILQIGEAPEEREYTAFQQWAQLHSKKGEITREIAAADGAAMVNGIDWSMWQHHKRRLGPLEESNMRFSMADNSIVPSQGRWTGIVDIGGVKTRQTFEVFDAHGAFFVLLGRPWLDAARAVQDFHEDTLTMKTKEGNVTLQNARPGRRTARRQRGREAEKKRQREAKREENKEREDAEGMTIVEGRITTKRATEERENERSKGEKTARAVREEVERKEREKTTEREDEKTRRTGKAEAAIMHIEALLVDRERVRRDIETEHTGEATREHKIHAVGSGGDPLRQVPPHVPLRPNPRLTKPHDPERVAQIVKEVTIGEDLSPAQRARVEGLVKEYADVFALNLSEVLPVDYIKHTLHVDPEAKLPTKTYQKPLTPAQKPWYYAKIDEMEEAGIVTRVRADQVKCAGPTTLAPKDYDGGGLTIEQLRYRANEECKKAGLPAMWEVDDTEPINKPTGQETEALPARWRLTVAFQALNRVTKVPPFPQGDLPRKQQRMAGKRWTSVIDFAAGFYAVPMDEDSVMYTAFHVEGRGYYVWLRMPFGLTGAPTTFGEMVMMALDDMIGRELEAYVDDVCLSGDDFEEKFQDITKFFQRCREKRLSLSPPKTKLFMTEVLFAGARLSKEGIKPNMNKVAAILDWPEPTSVLKLMGFLGLVGSYRGLIKDYAKIAQPLTDLTRHVPIPIPKHPGRPRRGAFKRALADAPVTYRFGDEERKAFARLKGVLTTEPVLKSPEYDGRAFIVTTDGAKIGYGAVLAQWFNFVKKDGSVVKRLHPVAFSSKRTSEAEERYKPFLLEFAALKFAIDKFSDIIAGQSLEIETDCQALSDFLQNDKLPPHHARWKEAVLGQRITAVRHRPGITNKVADGLSRKWTEHQGDCNDGEDWSVDPGWEATRGIVNDVFAVGNAVEETSIQTRFANDPYLMEVIEWLETKQLAGTADGKSKRRAQRRSQDFIIEAGKLWRVARGRQAWRAPRVECIPEQEAHEQAVRAHVDGGHFGRDLMILKLQQKYYWHNMQRSAVEAITECARCKGFGARHLNALLSPITRRYPFEMIAGDYLKLPKGFGGKSNVGLYIDVHSQYAWAQAFNHDGTGASTVGTLEQICNEFATPTEFMADGGSHFNCKEVRAFASRKGIRLRVTAAYAPWVNGLIEGSNKILLGRLRRLCAPDLGDDPSGEDFQWEDLPGDWPKHLSTAISQMNDRILSSTGYSPRELLLGMVIEDRRQEETETLVQTSPDDVAVHMAFVDSMHADAFRGSIAHAARRKARFDRKVKEIVFRENDLVQVYNNKLDGTFDTRAKLMRRWSSPMRIREKFNNSYTVETLEGLVLQGLTHARRLRRFIPRRDTELARLEKEAGEAERGEREREGERTILADEIARDGEEGAESDGSEQGEEERTEEEEGRDTEDGESERSEQGDGENKQAEGQDDRNEKDRRDAKDDWREEQDTQVEAEDIRVEEGDIRVEAGDIRVEAGDIRAEAGDIQNRGKDEDDTDTVAEDIRGEERARTRVPARGGPAPGDPGEPAEKPRVRRKGKGERIRERRDGLRRSARIRAETRRRS